MFPCLGLQMLGSCHYNPKQPYLTYFTLGDAVSALAFTLAIQQLLKPIYLFRLRAYGMKLSYIITPVFTGFACTLFAALLPHLGHPASGPLAYPVIWEMFGAMLIVAAYSVAIIVALRRPSIGAINLVSFVQAASTLLSHATDEDRISLAEDVLTKRNISRLFCFSNAWKAALNHEALIEFDRLRRLGHQEVIRGTPPPSAFYRFTHRRELEQASFAGTFLRIMSDQDMCSALVRKAPWLVSHILEEIAKSRMYSDQARQFVQEVAYQAIYQDESMMTKEIGYSGFNAVPLMSNSLFSNWFIVSHFEPLDRIDFDMPDPLTEGFVKRLNRASNEILKTAVTQQEMWDQRYLFAIHRHYEAIFFRWTHARFKIERFANASQVHIGVQELYKTAIKGQMVLACTPEHALYTRNADRHGDDLIGMVASIVYKSLECIANKFSGVDDEAWLHAIQTFQGLFPSQNGRPEGMNPLQQQLAVLLIDKLKDNMNGWYPSISRVLLACIGPYRAKPVGSGRSAFVILQDAMYGELKKLKPLHERKPEKISDFLPDNVAFDPVNNILTHTYRGGETAATSLDGLQLPNINLTDPINWQSGKICEP